MASLSIRNQEAIRLIRELAEREGISLTAAVLVAVREKLERDQEGKINEERMRYWTKFGKQVRASTDPNWLATNQFDDLYDENGLPK